MVFHISHWISFTVEYGGLALVYDILNVDNTTFSLILYDASALGTCILCQICLIFSGFDGN